MRQVVTELDAMSAVYDWLAEQLDDRLRYEFTSEIDTEAIDTLIEQLRDPARRHSADCMKQTLLQTVTDLNMCLVTCLLAGCEEDHSFEMAFVELVLDSHEKTAEWLKEKGVVVGLSAN